MKLLRFEDDAGAVRLGALDGDRVLDVSEAEDGGWPLSRADELLERVRAAMSHAPVVGHVDDVRLRAPVLHPRAGIYCVGWNYDEHFAEGAHRRPASQDAPTVPTFFSKPWTSIIGPGDAIAFDPDVTTELDYEGELAVIIGTGGRSIPPERALDHVLGYTLAVDVSARDVQRRHGGQWFKGKSMDTYCPLGPVVVSTDELPDLGRVTLRTWVNGDLRQEAPAAAMVFSVPTLISELSRGMTLCAGDVLLTGTPAGVGFALTPPSFLRPDDEVVVGVEEIGTLRAVVRDTSGRGEAAVSNQGNTGGEAC